MNRPDELLGWTFSAEERSAGAYVVFGVNRDGK
jgi:hypothetical protein